MTSEGLVKTRAPLSRYFALSSYWFGFSFHWFFLIPLLMPADVAHLVGEKDKGVYLGFLQGLPALIPLILPPFLGIWSDKLGKRMPFLIYGTLINVLGLLGMLLAPNYVLYFMSYLVVQLGNSLASSPYTALVPDVVPESDRGRASGVMGFFQLFSQVAGGIAAFTIATNRGSQYAIVIGVLLICTTITLFSVKEPQAKTKIPSNELLEIKDYLKPEYRDFRWVFLTRAFTETGRWAIQPFLLFYLKDVIKTFEVLGKKLATADLALTLMLVLLSVTAAITSMASGFIADVKGKKPVIYVAGGVMALAALGFAATSNYSVALIIVLLFGLGYGAFISVDWALGTSVLPKASSHARDMGVWHIAMVFPQIFLGFFGKILDFGNKQALNAGYPMLFGISVLFFVLGTVFVSRVRGVR